ncbi:hypothetical protein D9M69_352000 [compost metagenome]
MPQRPGLDRLGQVVVHARRQAGVALLGARVGGHRHDRQRGEARLLAQPTGGAQAIEHRHLHIHQHQRVATVGGAVQHGQGLGAIGGDLHLQAEAAQQAAGHFLAQLAVLHQQHALAGKAPRRFGGRRRALRRHHAERQAQPELAALAKPAVHPDAAAHRLGQALADRQAEPGAAVLAGDRAVGLLEGLEQPALLFGTEADAGVAHAEIQPHLRAVALLDAHRHLDLATLGEFQRVVGVVDQDLAEPQRVAEQPRRHLRVDVEQQGQALGRGLVADQPDQVLQHLVEIEGDAFEAQLAGLDLGEVEDVVEQTEQVLAGQLDLVQVTALARIEIAVEDQVGHADDGVHRRADLVADVGQEIALQLRRRLGQGPGLFQRRLEFAPRGDVAADAEQPQRAAVGILEGGADDIVQHLAAVRALPPFLAGQRLPAGQRGAVQAGAQAGLLGAQQRLVALPGEARPRPTEQVGERLVDPAVAAFVVLEPDRIGNRVDQRQQRAALLLGQGFGAPAFDDLHVQAAVPQQHEGQQQQDAEGVGPALAQQALPAEQLQRRQPARLDGAALLLAEGGQGLVEQVVEDRRVAAHGETDFAAGQAALAAQLEVGQAEFADQVAGHHHVADIGLGAPAGHRPQRRLGGLRLHQQGLRYAPPQQFAERVAALHGHALAGQVVEALHLHVVATEDQAVADQVGLAEQHPPFPLRGLRHRRQHVDPAGTQRLQGLIPAVEVHRLDAQAQASGGPFQVVGADPAVAAVALDDIERRPARALDAHAQRRMRIAPGALLDAQRQPLGLRPGDRIKPSRTLAIAPPSLPSPVQA